MSESNQLDTILSNLDEKRAETREKALSDLCNFLRFNTGDESFTNNTETIIEGIKKELKKGTLKGKILSMEALTLVAIELGLEAERVFKEFSPTLQELLATYDNDGIKSMAASALSMLCFVANSDELETQKIARLLEEKAFSKISTSLKTTCLENWCLLLTTINATIVMNDFVSKALPELLKTLQESDVDLQLATGQAISLLFEIGLFANGEEYTLREMAKNAKVDINVLLDRLYEVSPDKNQTRSKKEKQKRKSGFREFLGFLENKEEPEEILSISNQKFEFHSWSKIVQLEALRNFLGEGFQNHFQNNSLISDILDANFEKNFVKAKLTAQEKRLMMSPNSKASKMRTKKLSNLRDQERLVNHTMIADDDGIVGGDNGTSAPDIKIAKQKPLQTVPILPSENGEKRLNNGNH